MRNISSLSDTSLTQLCEMNHKAQQLCELMKKGIVEFIFKKKSTGKMRKAHGTLKRSLIPPEAQRKRGRPKKRPEDLVIYYDTDKNAIRSFKDYLLKNFSKSKSLSGEEASNKEDIENGKEKKSSSIKKKQGA